MKRAWLAGLACLVTMVGMAVGADAPVAEKGHKPVVYVIGDSTVKNGADTGGTGSGAGGISCITILIRAW